jgi:hypothetical protein
MLDRVGREGHTMSSDTPEAPRETGRSGLVTTFWLLLSALILVAVVSAITAFLRLDDLKGFSEIWGNLASVLGCWFGLIAFLVTILTLLLTAQAEKDAARKAELAAEKAERAVNAAEKRTALIVARLAMQVLEAGCVLLGRSVKHIQALVGRAMSAQDPPEWRRLWQEIAERCREGTESAGDLLANPQMEAAEREALTRRVSGLGQIASFVERNRLPGDKNGKLSDEHATTLDDLFALLTDIRCRLRRCVYEAPDASRR